jgi:hypothetical protein
VDYQDLQLDFGQSFRRVTMNDLVQELTGMDVLGFGADLEGAKAAAHAALQQADADTRRCAQVAGGGWRAAGQRRRSALGAAGATGTWHGRRLLGR